MSEQEDAALSIDFDEIYEAVMDTPRGRWFLKELAERNKVSDTEQLLLAIERIRHSIQPGAATGHIDQSGILEAELNELAKTIQDTRKEIAAIKPRNTASSRITSNSEEFDAIITSTERATSDIISAAEKLQEISDHLRSRDWDKALSEELEDISTSIFMACSFQDITSQRTTKVVNGMRYLEQRIKAMLEVWCGKTNEPAAEPTEPGTSGKIEEKEADASNPAAPVTADDADASVQSASTKAEDPGAQPEVQRKIDGADVDENDAPSIDDDTFDYDADSILETDDDQIEQKLEGTAASGRLADWVSS